MGTALFFEATENVYLPKYKYKDTNTRNRCHVSYLLQSDNLFFCTPSRGNGTSPRVPFSPPSVQNAMDPVTACNNCIMQHGCTARRVWVLFLTGVHYLDRSQLWSINSIVRNGRGFGGTVNIFFSYFEQLFVCLLNYACTRRK